jgi:hypothetical protein
MSWQDYYRRRDALDRVIETGELDPDGFGGTGELLLALHHLWSRRLTGRIELAMLDEDPADAVSIAWRETAAAYPKLRRLLDEHAAHPALREVTTTVMVPSA